jgi:hypothetical protein
MKSAFPQIPAKRPAKRAELKVPTVQRFGLPIATRAQSDRTNSIRGKL